MLFVARPNFRSFHEFKLRLRGCMPVGLNSTKLLLTSKRVTCQWPNATRPVSVTSTFASCGRMTGDFLLFQFQSLVLDQSPRGCNRSSHYTLQYSTLTVTVTVRKHLISQPGHLGPWPLFFILFIIIIAYHTQGQGLMQVYRHT